MTQKQILEALGPSSSTFKELSAKLYKAWQLVADLRTLPGYDVELSVETGNVEVTRSLNKFSRVTQPKDWEACEASKEIFGEFLTWQKLTVKHSRGAYSVYLPTGSKLYYSFLDHCGIKIQVAPEFMEQPAETISIDPAIFAFMDKALRYVSKDMLRPAMTHVCLALDKGTATVAATDAYRLYVSKPVESSHTGDRLELLFTPDAAKEISKIKFDGTRTDLGILKEKDAMTAVINGKRFALFTEGRFPDYRVIMPDYCNFVEFDRKEMIAQVKKVLPFANRSTYQVELDLNGSIHLHTQDVDFSFECNADMPMIAKNFEGLRIAFNGKYLTDLLGTFKEKTVKMYFGGSTKAGVVRTDQETALLMPLMLAA